MMRDYVYRVHGDCVRAGYAYPLLAALKLHVPDIALDLRVYFGPLTGVIHLGHGHLGIRHGTEWRCRAPSDAQGRLSKLCGRKLLLVHHVIQLGQLHVEEIAPSPVLHAELVVVKSQHFEKWERHPGHREFLGGVTDKLRTQYAMDGVQLEVGRRRVIQIGEHPAASGYAVCLYGVSDGVSFDIQRDGLGGRRHMGASLFMPGPLPSYARDERRLYDVRPTDWHRKKPKCVRPLDAEDVPRAVLFLTAVREGKHPGAKWLAEQEGISRTRADRIINALKHDKNLPLTYNPDYKGWETDNGIHDSNSPHA